MDAGHDAGLLRRSSRRSTGAVEQNPWCSESVQEVPVTDEANMELAMSPLSNSAQSPLYRTEAPTVHSSALQNAALTLPADIEEKSHFTAHESSQANEYADSPTETFTETSSPSETSHQPAVTAPRTYSSVVRQSLAADTPPVLSLLRRKRG